MDIRNIAIIAHVDPSAPLGISKGLLLKCDVLYGTVNS